MGFLEAIRTVLSKYASFQGRARRSEFWWWMLAVFVIAAIAGLIDVFLIAPWLGFSPADESAGRPFSILVGLLLLIPNLAVGARRLHDTGRSAWWLLIGIVPLAGAIVLIYWYVQPGTTGTNAFGMDPARNDPVKSNSEFY